ncbi:MAG TPA: DUF2778 domain-containing protein [Thiomicrorhabdus sp.]|nr:DUF2778 domain-containing protein [Thiomicrorhabdus sp.]
MEWEYSQSTGVLKFNHTKVATGYAGYGSAKNKSAMQHMKNVGPIPRGEYEIKAPRTSARTGPYVLPLLPVGHNALGRTHFQIHGDSRLNPGTASNGCIIMPRAIREKIWHSGIKKLRVIR